MTASTPSDPSGHDSISLILSAAAFAADKHRKQRRKDEDASPYINHPLALAQVLACEALETDEYLVAAALLHDTVEDTDTTFQELEQRFGKRIEGIVREVTDDKLLSKEDRKRLQVEHVANASPEAKLVKLADKICNLRDIIAAPPAGWSLERRLEYFDWAKRVVDQMRGAHPRLEQLFDAEYAERQTMADNFPRELVPLALAVPGWEGRLTREAVERVARGVEAEQKRLAGNSFLVVVRVYQLDYEGIYETVEIISGHTDLDEALARAQSIGAVRIVDEGRKRDPERKWKHAPAKNNWPKVHVRYRERKLPVFADRLSDGTGYNAVEVGVAVIPTDPKTPINGELVKVIDMMPEMVAWFSKVQP